MRDEPRRTWPPRPKNCESTRMAAEHRPKHKRMQEALEQGRGRARERAKHTDEWT